MLASREPDSDRPPGTGPLGRLQLRAGRLAILAVNLLKPRLSLGVRLVALDAEGRRVFLVRHSYLPGLYLPGGGVDAGESAPAAVQREAREEAGLELPEPPALFGVYWNRALAGRDHVLLYVARGVRVAGPRRARLEIVGGGFYPVDDVPADATPATRARLAEVLEGVPPKDTW